MKLFIGIILLVCIYVVGWYQLHGQFINPWFKKYEYILLFLSVPNTYISIRAIKMISDYFQGQVWPNRMLTLSIGLVMFTIMSYCHFNEKLGLKTLTLIGLALLIVTLQILWE
jgi:hypothetical protein